MLGPKDDYPKNICWPKKGRGQPVSVSNFKTSYTVGLKILTTKVETYAIVQLQT